ncbi:MAG TPA: DUF6049 family protein [Actinomycetota bacterium]|nr:DUF6049 family protein [Actinomycetota bacterium]
MTGTRTVTRALAALAVATTLVATLAAAAPAQDAAPAFEVVLTQISPAVSPEDPLSYRVAVRNRGQAPVRVQSVQALLGLPVDTRSDLANLLAAPAGSLNGQQLDQFQPAAEVAPGASLQLEARQVPLPPGVGDQQAGVVLPLTIRVGAGGVTAGLTTFVVDLPVPATKPLRAALLVPVREPTHRNPAGDFIDDKLADLLAPGGSLGAVAKELSRPDAPPVTMVVDAMLVEDATAMVGGWRLRQEGQRTPVPAGDPRSGHADRFLQRLKAAARNQAARNQPPAAFAYGNADLPALVAAGGGDRAKVAVGVGRSEVENGLGTAPEESLAWPVDGAVDGALLRTIEQTGSDVVVLDPRHLPAPPTAVTPNATVDLGAGPGGQRALVGDAVLSAALADPRAGSAPVEWAQRVLAETAVTWLERPNSSDPRGILLAPPQDWRPSGTFFRALVQRLGAAPWLRLQPAATLAGDVSQGPGEGERRLATVTHDDRQLGLPPSYLNRVAQTRSELDSFRRAVGNDERPGADSFDRDLLVAESSDWRPAGAPRTRGRGFVGVVRLNIRSVYRRIEVGTTPVTLTARRGKIPITVTNNSAERVTVVLRLTSPKVDLPAASEPFVLEPRRRTTQLLEVGTRATGTFPIQVDVLTPDGEVEIAGGEVRLTSTALNRVALALTGGAAGLLLVWWGVGRRRRAGNGS